MTNETQKDYILLSSFKSSLINVIITNQLPSKNIVDVIKKNRTSNRRIKKFQLYYAV